MIRRALPLWLGLGLTACVATEPPPPPAPEPLPVLRPAVEPEPIQQSAASRYAVRLYAEREARLLAEGKLKTDDSAAFDITAEELALNFEQIALFSEFSRQNGRYVVRQRVRDIGRWVRPVRVQLHFGASVNQATRAADTAQVEQYVQRLSDISGHPIRVVETGGNFHVFLVNVDELNRLGPAISAVEPRLEAPAIDQITSLNLSTYCAVFASSASVLKNAYITAIAVVRAEHPDLSRLACYHEEIVQGLGLFNDSPAVRSSIFNDDGEFALLTEHDALLLRILYDDRLRIGMTAEEARPIIRQIAEELIGERTERSPQCPSSTSCPDSSSTLSNGLTIQETRSFIASNATATRSNTGPS